MEAKELNEILEKPEWPMNVRRNPYSNEKHMFSGGEAYGEWYLHPIMTNGLIPISRGNGNP